jgi:transcriptional regulator with XRE-family HTH domain
VKKDKVKHILRVIRKIQGMFQSDVQRNGHKIESISLFENNVLTPSRKTIIGIAKALKVKPDVLFYSFGILPDEEMNIIKSDPFYYMQKIKKLCYNHDNRYGENDFDLNQMNYARAVDYINSGKAKDEGSTED